MSHQINYSTMKPTPTLLKWFEANNYLPPYQYVSGLGWYVHTINNEFIPVLANPMPEDFRQQLSVNLKND